MTLHASIGTGGNGANMKIEKTKPKKGITELVRIET